MRIGLSYRRNRQVVGSFTSTVALGMRAPELFANRDCQRRAASPDVVLSSELQTGIVIADDLQGVQAVLKLLADGQVVLSDETFSLSLASKMSLIHTKMRLLSAGSNHSMWQL